MTVPKCILITGATGAIGGALAAAYAAPGLTLILHGRNPEKLAAIGEQCRGRGAEVVLESIDIRAAEPLIDWLGKLDERFGIDLLIVNAGMNTNIGPDGVGEEWAAVNALLDTNLRATMAMVHAILPGMRRRRGGQIVLISSLAAWFGLPVTPSYCASKAAIKVYGEALRGWLAPEGIRVNVVMPGYVESPMCHEMPGPKPFLWTPERAARVIRRGLVKDKARISFPFPLNLGTWFLAVMPPALSFFFLRLFNYRG